MNYLNYYFQLMSTRKNMNRKKGDGQYFENHHIIPRWLNGTDEKDNLVLLTAKEHYLSHLLLWKHYRDRPSALAFHKMTKSNNKNQNRIFNSRQFEKARIAFSESQKGDLNWTRINGSPNKGKPNPHKGKKLGKRENVTGDKNPSKRPDVRIKISEGLKGHKKSPDHLKKLNDVFFNKPKLICEHCKASVDYRNYGRWHGIKCKHKE